MKGTGLNTALFLPHLAPSSFPQVLCYSQSPLSHTISFTLLSHKLSCCNSRLSVMKSQFSAVRPMRGCHRIPLASPRKVCLVLQIHLLCAWQAKPVATVGLIFIYAFQNKWREDSSGELSELSAYKCSATLFLWSCDFERYLVMDLRQEFGFYLNNLAGILLHMPQHETSLWWTHARRSDKWQLQMQIQQQ